MTQHSDRFSRQIALGTAFGILSSLAYTVANSCLRTVAMELDPVWVSCVRAVPVAVVSLGICVWRAGQGKRVMPDPHGLLRLVVAAVFVQFAGNVAFQWALGQVGLSVAVPLLFGTMILGGAIFGWAWLGEPISMRHGMSLTLLIAAILLISLKSSTQSTANDLQSHGMWMLRLGVAAACLAGVAYALINTVIRSLVTGHTSLSTTLMVISVSGVLLLGATSLLRSGMSVLINISGHDYLIILTAGVFNAVAFYSIGKSLQLIPVARVNALISSQTGMTALVGIFVFGELASFGLIAGVVLMIVGLSMMSKFQN